MNQRILAVAFAATLAGCGSDNPVTPPPPTTPPGPTAASISVTQGSQAQICRSPTPGFNYRLRMPLRIVESAGLGANINFARLTLFLRGVEVERREIGSAQIIAGVGTNRLNPNSTQNVVTTFDFNNDTFDTERFELGFTDDRGNSSTIVVPITNVIGLNTCTI